MFSGACSRIKSFVSDLFLPIPQEPSVPPARKERLDHVAEFLDSSNGSWDFFRVADLALSYLKLLPSLSDLNKGLINRASNVVNLSGTALSVPQFFSGLNKLRKSVTEFFSMQDIPYSDPLRSQKRVQSAKHVVIDGLNVTNTFSQALTFFNEAKVVDLAKHIPLIDFVYQGTSFLTDGTEIVDEIYKVRSYQEAQAASRSPRESSELEDKIWLSKMKVVRNTASVALAVIALGALFFGVTVSAITFVATVVLALSTVWLTMKIACYFYDKILTERHAGLHPGIQLPA